MGDDHVTVTDPGGTTTTVTLPAIPSVPAATVSVCCLTIDLQGDAWVSRSWLSMTVTGTTTNPVYHHDVFDRISPQGGVTEFTVAGPGPYAVAVVTGHDGAIWYADEENYPVNGGATYADYAAIGRVTTDGVFTSYGTNFGAQRMIDASDGAIWFDAGGGDVHRMGRITMAGAVSYITTPFSPNAITAGNDGDVWVAGLLQTAGGFQPVAARVTVQGVTTTMNLPQSSTVADLALAPDGNLWFTDDQTAYDAFGVLQPDGNVEEFPTHSTCPTCIPVNHGTLQGLTWANGYLWSTEWFGNTSATTWRLMIAS